MAALLAGADCGGPNHFLRTSARAAGRKPHPNGSGGGVMSHLCDSAGDWASATTSFFRSSQRRESSAATLDKGQALMPSRHKGIVKFESGKGLRARPIVVPSVPGCSANPMPHPSAAARASGTQDLLTSTQQGTTRDCLGQKQEVACLSKGWTSTLPNLIKVFTRRPQEQPPERTNQPDIPRPWRLRAQRLAEDHAAASSQACPAPLSDPITEGHFP